MRAYGARMKITPLVLLLAILAAFAVAGCGGSSSSGDTGATSAEGATSAIGGGSAACDQATFDAWVTAWGESEGSSAKLADGAFTCADGWAVLTPTVGDGGDGYDTVVVVQAEGPVWALMDRGKVCGTSASDAQVPASLYDAACTTS